MVSTCLISCVTAIRMKVVETQLPGVLIIEPQVFDDARGFFLETWNQARYNALGFPAYFVQDNLSCSTRGTLRGLHFQNPHSQGKLVYVPQGEVFDVVVDIRVGSPTFARWISVVLSGESRQQLYIPEGFAHGFCVTSEQALLAYKSTALYYPQAEGGILWNDPNLGIDWPIHTPLLSEKDQGFPLLKEIPSEQLPRYLGQP